LHMFWTQPPNSVYCKPSVFSAVHMTAHQMQEYHRLEYINIQLWTNTSNFIKVNCDSDQ
jgi:hypothetical protein